ncbi:MAG: hypothetical protein IKZ87_04310 [Actinomycetaceae bacterium]|nr:hypothetical protein [Actinomycetaceae bacterium]
MKKNERNRGKERNVNQEDYRWNKREEWEEKYLDEDSMTLEQMYRAELKEWKLTKDLFDQEWSEFYKMLAFEALTDSTSDYTWMMELQEKYGEMFKKTPFYQAAERPWDDQEYYLHAGMFFPTVEREKLERRLMGDWSGVPTFLETLAQMDAQLAQ